MIILVRPLRVQFHRTMMYASHDVYLRVRATSLPEMKSRWMSDHTLWHRDQLVRMGYLHRGTYRFHSLVVPSREYSDLLSKLPFVSGDYYWSIGRDEIEVYAPRPELDRLMAIAQAHDVKPAERVSSEPDSE